MRACCRWKNSPAKLVERWSGRLQFACSSTDAIKFGEPTNRKLLFLEPIQRHSSTKTICFALCPSLTDCPKVCRIRQMPPLFLSLSLSRPIRSPSLAAAHLSRERERATDCSCGPIHVLLGGARTSEHAAASENKATSARLNEKRPAATTTPMLNSLLGARRTQ